VEVLADLADGGQPDDGYVVLVHGAGLAPMLVFTWTVLADRSPRRLEQVILHQQFAGGPNVLGPHVRRIALNAAAIPTPCS